MNRLILTGQCTLAIVITCMALKSVWPKICNHVSTLFVSIKKYTVLGLTALWLWPQSRPPENRNTRRYRGQTRPWRQPPPPPPPPLRRRSDHILHHVITGAEEEEEEDKVDQMGVMDESDVFYSFASASAPTNDDNMQGN